MYLYVFLFMCVYINKYIHICMYAYTAYPI